MVAPVVDCSTYQGSQTAPVLQWACVLLLHPIVNNASGNSQSVAGGTTTSGSNQTPTKGQGNSGSNGQGNGGSNGNANGNGNGGGSTSSAQMYLEYLGSAAAAGSPCASVGLPGGGTTSGPLVAALVR